MRFAASDRGRRRLMSGLAVAAVAVMTLEGCRQRSQGDDPPAAAPSASTAVNAAASLPASFPDIYDRVSPAVVSVNAAQVARGPALFSDRGGPPGSAGGMVQSMSSGSGFFISAEGHILTNNHVIASANELEVVLRDGQRLPARVLGRDEASDLAVLKVEGSDFPHVTFASAANPRVGEAVIAIGNPFGLGATATHGIVSAYGRNIGSPYVDFVQLDAAINQGNSGGPTFNGQGEVVGVNTAIFSPTGGSVGIGFAIPATVASQVAEQLIRNGRVERGFIGAVLAPAAIPAAGRLNAAGGALVISVVAGGPAARAGLRPRDVILEIGGEAVNDPGEVIRAVVQSEPEDRLEMTVLRGGRRADVVVPVERR